MQGVANDAPFSYQVARHKNRVPVPGVLLVDSSGQQVLPAVTDCAAHLRAQPHPLGLTLGLFIPRLPVLVCCIVLVALANAHCFCTVEIGQHRKTIPYIFLHWPFGPVINIFLRWALQQAKLQRVGVKGPLQRSRTVPGVLLVDGAGQQVPVRVDGVRVVPDDELAVSQRRQHVRLVVPAQGLDHRA